jgi:uncharacterized membrane protein YkoI
MKISKTIVPGIAVVAAVAGIAGGSAINALTASADTAATTTATTAAADTSTTASTDSTDTSAATAQRDESKGGHQANGVTETVLTGDEATKAIAAAKAAVPGATVLRAETDAEGAKYEVHMQKSDGSRVTVKLDASFKVTTTETGANGPGNKSDDSSTTNN